MTKINTSHGRRQILKTIAPPLRVSDNQRTALNDEVLHRLSKGIPLENDPSLAQLVRPSDGFEPVQRWFTYREGYTVELCRRYFSPTDDLVIDPFCGFGTTLVAAKAVGLQSIGLDVNPLAVFVSRVKTRSYTTYQLRLIRRAIDALSCLKRNANCHPTPALKILPRLFHEEILDALSRFRFAIESIDNAVVKDFILLAWIAILEDVSNVYREGNGIKYRNRHRKGNNYSVIPYAEWEQGQFPSDKFLYVKERLIGHLNLMIAEVNHYEGPAPVIHQADAAHSQFAVPPKGASLALFSPPYCNCFNYIKAYKLELWMAGFIQTYPDIRLLTQMGMRSRLESLLDPVKEPYPQIIENLVALMKANDLWSPQLPDMIRGYFADMLRTLTAIFLSLREGGKCVVTVGNSCYAGVLIPSDLLLCQVAKSAGFVVEKLVVARHLTTSSQQKRMLADSTKVFLRESVLHFRKP